MKSNQLFIGIDVSKGYADFVILASNKSLYTSGFQLDDTSLGHEVLHQKILSLIKAGYQIICGVENTGGYERNWVFGLKTLAKGNSLVEVYKLNPKAIKHQIQSLLRRTIDDGISAEGIAMYMINNYLVFKENWLKSISQVTQIGDSQLLHSMIQGLIKQRTMKINQFEKVLYQTFPEMLVYIKNSIPKWVFGLMERYPSASSARRATIKGISSIKGISEEKAKVIKERALYSVASESGEIPEMIISQHCKDITHLEKEINKLKVVLVEQYQGNEDLDLLTSVRGIGEWTAVAFLIELGDFKRFENTDQLAAFFGVNPSFKQSGDGRFSVKMSKQGNPRMRSILYLIAHNVFMHNEYFKSLYEKHKSSGKKHRVIMGVLMHKALRIMWGMLQNRTRFDSGIDLLNQEKRHQKEEQPEISLKSRYLQKLTMDAPISRSNSKKRKAMLTPQSSTKNESTRSLEHSSLQI